MPMKKLTVKWPWPDEQKPTEDNDKCNKRRK